MKEKKPKISIITAFYNCEQFLPISINSINAQIISDDIEVEYVLVDDNSTDGSYEIARNIVNNPHFNKSIEVRLMKTPENLGCGGARRFAIEQGTGDYFMFLDGDDYYMNRDFVSRAYHDISTNNADIVEYGLIFNDPMNGVKRPICPPNEIVLENSKDAVIKLFNGLLRFNVWTKIYTSYIINSFPYDTTREYEDIRTIPFWIQNAAKIIVKPSLEINWRANPKSIIRDDSIRTRLGTCQAFADICEEFKNSHEIISAIYNRAMIDLTAVLNGKTSDDPGFNELSLLNTKMLSYVYPDQYKDLTYNIEDDLNNSQITVIDGGKIESEN